MTDCIVAFNGRGIVSDGDAVGVEVERNCVLGSSAAFSYINAGRSNIEKDPRFAAQEEGDYRLHNASPCIGAARDGANMGYL